MKNARIALFLQISTKKCLLWIVCINIDPMLRQVYLIRVGNVAGNEKECLMATYDNDKKEYASSGVGTAGLTLGVIGTALASGILGNNGGGGLLNGGLFSGNQCAQNSHVNAILAEKDATIARLNGEKYTDSKTLELYSYNVGQNEKLMNYLVGLDKRVSSLETAGPLREQLVQQQITCCCNSANAAIAQLQATVAGLTKTVIPATSVCPQPMPQYNSWTAPTAASTTAASNG